MKKKKDDFYIAMLRFGQSKLNSGFRLEELVSFLKANNYNANSEHSTLLHQYFPVTFYTKSPMPYPDLVSFYFLRPESYFNLLNYDSLQQSKRQAFEARIFAIVAIVISIVTLLVT